MSGRLHDRDRATLSPVEFAPATILFDASPQPPLWLPGGYNDGAGFDSAVYTNPNLQFNGKPTICLDTLGNSLGTQTNPGNSPDTSGVVYKQRLWDDDDSAFGVSTWFNFTSNSNHTSNPSGTVGVLFVIELYNRDGDEQPIGRLWVEQYQVISESGDPSRLSTRLWILDEDDTWRIISEQNNSSQGHVWQPWASTGSRDRAINWGFVKLACDFRTKEYLYAIFNGEIIPLLGRGMKLNTYTSQTSARAHHFGVEYGSCTATRKAMHITGLVGTAEGRA